MSTGVDIVFCLDRSASMGPCFDQLRARIDSFVENIEQVMQPSGGVRLELFAHSASPRVGDRNLTAFDQSTLRTNGMGMIEKLYTNPDDSAFFTSDIEEFREGLRGLRPLGDEATLVAIDTAMDLPWRPRATCHRVLIVLTDERIEDGMDAEDQPSKIDPVADKVAQLGLLLFLVGPESDIMADLASVDRCLYQPVGGQHDGLQSVDFELILGNIAGSITASRLDGQNEPAGIERALFGQNKWVPGRGTDEGA